MAHDNRAGNARPAQSPSEFWGAKDSLRRNFGKRSTAGKRSEEVESTPLLGNGSGHASNDSGGRRDAEWEGHNDYEGLSWRQKPSMYWLLPPFFLFALAVGGIIVPKLNMILTLICRDYFIERERMGDAPLILPVVLGDANPQCRIPQVQALATRFTLYLTIIAGLLSAFMAPKLGALSDRFGRLKLLVVTGAGAFIGEIITILAATYPDSIHYNWILVGAVLDGFCGSFTAAMAITHAYAADCTPPPKRAVAFGYFHASLFSGIAVGPLIAAALVKFTGSLISIFYFALGVHVFFIIFILGIAPESLTQKRQQHARDKYAAEHADSRYSELSRTAVLLKEANIIAPLKVLFPTGPGTSNHLRANLILLSAIDTIIFGVAMGAMTVVIYYTGYQFGWDTADISLFTSLVNTFRVTGLVVVLPLLNYLVRTRRANRQRRESGFAVPEPNSGTDQLDLYVIRFAILCEVIGYAGYAAARTGGLFVGSGIFAALGGIGSPTLQSALTKHVPQDTIGSLLGATGLLHALARIVCPLIFNLIYAGTVGSFPQAVFVVLTCCFGVAFLCSWGLRPNIYLEDLAVPDSSNHVLQGDADILIDEEIVNV